MNDAELISSLHRAHREQIGFLDALAAVEDRLKARPWVINCWVYSHDKWTDQPDCTLGPYLTREDAETAATALTCTHEIDRPQWRLNPPEWTTS